MTLSSTNEIQVQTIQKVQTRVISCMHQTIAIYGMNREPQRNTQNFPENVLTYIRELCDTSADVINFYLYVSTFYCRVTSG